MNPTEALANSRQETVDETGAAEAACWLANPSEPTKRQTAAQMLAEQPPWEGGEEEPE